MLPPVPTLPTLHEQGGVPSSPPVIGDGWASVLRQAGWPTDLVVLDFECYFDSAYSMGKGKLSTIEYIENSKYEELGVACLVVRGTQPFAPKQATFWPNVKEQLLWLQKQFGPNLEGCTVVIQNARFDGTILTRKHRLVPAYVVDTLALSRHLDARNTHNLADLCKRYNLPDKGDTMEFKGLHWAEATDDQKMALASYACNDAEREWDLFALLLPRLTRPQIELRLQYHTLRMYWEPGLAFDFAEAERLAGLMEAQVAKDVEPTGATPEEISGNKSFAALLSAALAETGEALAMKLGKKGMIAALAKDDSAVTEYRRHRNPRVRALIKARAAVKSWPLHIKRLNAMTRQAKAAGGRLPNPLNYYGAHTGRWSGGEGINTCNLPTRGDGLATEIKHTLIAPDGEVMILADAAQIEARGLAWIAGQDDLCRAFANNQDVYSDFSTEVLLAPFRKPTKSDPPAVAKLLGARRATGKVGILGMGYGMGAVRALDYMETYPELRPKVESGEIDLSFCKRFVEGYRSRYPMVPRFWKDLENAFRFTTRYGQSRTLRGLTLSREGTTTIIQLPSGRCLFYPHAAVGSEDRLRFHWGDLWGGTLTENVVQATSRDILAEALLFVEDHGFRVAHHVYDSLVVCVPEVQQTVAYACVSEALTRVPSWASGWPLGVEATIGRRYD